MDILKKLQLVWDFVKVIKEKVLLLTSQLHAFTEKYPKQNMEKQNLEAYLEPCQTSKMELFAKIVNDWKPLSIFAKRSILEFWPGSEYSSGISSGRHVPYFGHERKHVDYETCICLFLY